MDEMRVFEAAEADENRKPIEFGVKVKGKGKGAGDRVEKFAVERPVPGQAVTRMARAYRTQTLGLKQVIRLPEAEQAEAMGPISADTAVAIDQFLQDVLGDTEFERFERISLEARLSPKQTTALVKMIMSEASGAPFTPSSGASSPPSDDGAR